MRVSGFELLEYVVERLGSVICLTVPILSHYLPQSGSRTNVSENFFHRVQVVGILVHLFRIFFGTCLFLCWFFFFPVIAIALACWNWGRCSPCGRSRCLPMPLVIDAANCILAYSPVQPSLPCQQFIITAGRRCVVGKAEMRRLLQANLVTFLTIWNLSNVAVVVTPVPLLSKAYMLSGFFTVLAAHRISTNPAYSEDVALLSEVHRDVWVLQPLVRKVFA